MLVKTLRPHQNAFGKTFLKADNGMNRHKSYQDIGALLDWMKTRPDIDADRVTVTTDCGLKQLPRPVARQKLSALVAGTLLVRRELT